MPWPTQLGLATAGDISAINREIAGIDGRLDGAFNRIDQNEEGLAVSIALSDPDLFNGQKFALKGNWGTFEGSNALGFTARGLLAQNLFGTNSQLTMSGGLGFGLDGDTMGGRVSTQIGW